MAKGNYFIGILIFKSPIKPKTNMFMQIFSFVKKYMRKNNRMKHRNIKFALFLGSQL